MKYTLQIIQGGGDNAAVYELKIGENLLGRAADADFQLKDSTISNKQCVILWERQGTEDMLWLQNLSQFGTKIDARRVSRGDDAVLLRPGQIITVGDRTQIRLCAEDENRTLSSEDFANANVVRLSEHSVHNSPNEAYNVAASPASETVPPPIDATVSPASETVPPPIDATKSPASETVPPPIDATVSPAEPNGMPDNYGASGVSSSHADTVSGKESNKEILDEAENMKSKNTPGNSSAENDGGMTNDNFLNKASGSSSGRVFVADEQGNTKSFNQGNRTTSKNEKDHDSGKGKASRAKNDRKNVGTVPDQVAGNGGTWVDNGATRPDETQTTDGNMPFEDGPWQRCLQYLSKAKWPLVMVFALFVLFLGKDRNLKQLLPEGKIGFKEVMVDGKKQKDIEAAPIFPSPFNETSYDSSTPDGKPETEMAVEEKGKPLFHVLYPRSSNATCRPESADRLVIHSFLGQNGNVPLNICLERMQKKENLRMDFNEAKELLRKKLEKDGLKIRDSITDMYDFTDYFFPEGDGGQNGLRYWQAAYTRDERQTLGNNEEKAEVPEDGNGPSADIRKQILQNASMPSWYGVLRFFRNEDVNYVLSVEVPEYVREQAEQFLTGNTFLRFEMDDGEQLENTFIALCWEGDGSFTESGRLNQQALDSFQERFNKQTNPQLYSEQEKTLMQFLASAKYYHDKNLYDRAFRLFRQLRLNRQRNYYNQLRLQWQDTAGTAAEQESHRQIQNMAELVFNRAEDARYSKVRRNEWD